MSALAFSAPLALLGLIALPALWLFLRVTPPRPARAPFPPLRLLMGLRPTDETPARTPWPLLILRLAIAALAAIALAGPVWAPHAAGPGGALVAAIDDGWTAAPEWAARKRLAAAAIEAAGRAGAPVALVGVGDAVAEWTDSARALDRLRAMAPKPWAVDRARAAAAIAAIAAGRAPGRILWIADGLENGGARAFAEKLAALAPLEIARAGAGPRAVGALRHEAGALVATVARPDATGPAAGRLRAYDLRGAVVGDAPFAFTPARALTAEARLEAPVELRNAVAWLALEGERSAGAVALIDEGHRRRKVGLASAATIDLAQPLLAPNYYLAKALAPFAEVRETRANAADPIGQLLDEGVGVLVLSDVVVAAGPLRDRLDRFLAEGGVLVRFAGPRLAAATDDLTPVALRRGGRTLGGALSWETPKKLRPMERASPFFGLPAPADVAVSRQVLAEPEPGLTERVWAQLEDGTPVVTAERRGRGLLALFHVTADTTWSNLPLSGVFPDMLRRLTSLASREPGGAASADVARGERAVAAPPFRTLDGFGALQTPPATARPLDPAEPARASADQPPGFYGAPPALVALNAWTPDEGLTPADFSGLPVQALALTTPQPIDLRPYGLAAMAALFALDGLIAVFLAGRMGRRAPARLALALGAAVLMSGALFPQRAAAEPAGEASSEAAGEAASPRDVRAALATRLAYVVTGDARVDETSRLGLAELSRTLAERTSLTPAEPAGVDPARDELVFYPFLYWPIVAQRPQPPTQAVQKIAAFMKNGGLIVFDTRDALTARADADPSPETLWLRALLRGVDTPALEPLPHDHVATKTFYLLDDFVGRTTNGQTWIEALPPESASERRPARAGDSVSPLVIVANDLAAAWARDEWGAPLYPLSPGGARQREMALRGGVNLVMYTLTGNYKADQVHVRDLLNRLGR